MKKKYTFIDLFAGCGGLSEGFLRTGRYTALAHVEWERPMVKTLRNRLISKWGETDTTAKEKVVLFDIQMTEELINGNWSDIAIQSYGPDNSTIVKERGLKGIVGDKHVDLIIGGPPCQAYSIHGRATDKDSMNNDYRNYLFESFCKVVDAFRPEMFVFENVAGLLSAKPGGIPVRNRIFEAFTKIGYDIRTPEDMPKALYDAALFEVPQHRPRVIILGIRKDTNLKLDDFYESIDQERRPDVKLTVKDAIGNLPALYPLAEPIKEGRIVRSHQMCKDKAITQHDARNHAKREQSIFEDWVKNNMNHIGHQAMIDYYFEKTGHKTLYQKYKSLEWDKPSHTVVAHLSKDGYMFIHPDPEQKRSITIREAACLMTFPMDFEFLGSSPYNFRMIGNAVPVNFASAIARAIYKELDRKKI